MTQYICCFVFFSLFCTPHLTGWPTGPLFQGQNLIIIDCDATVQALASKSKKLNMQYTSSHFFKVLRWPAFHGSLRWTWYLISTSLKATITVSPSKTYWLSKCDTLFHFHETKITLQRHIRKRVVAYNTNDSNKMNKNTVHSSPE